MTVMSGTTLLHKLPHSPQHTDSGYFSTAKRNSLGEVIREDEDVLSVHFKAEEDSDSDLDLDNGDKENETLLNLTDPLNSSPSDITTTTQQHHPAQHYQREQLLQQTLFADKRNRLLKLIGTTGTLVKRVKDANATGDLAVTYPPLSRSFPNKNDRDSEDASVVARVETSRRPSSMISPMRRSLSYVGAPKQESQAEGCVSVSRRFSQFSQEISTHANVHDGYPSNNSATDGNCKTQNVRRPGSLQNRRNSESFVSRGSANPNSHEMSVLNLELKLGNAVLNSAIAPESVSTLFDERLAGALKYLEALTERVADSSSKVLVTGDLNAGKSTLVNALLRREVLPVDQQPCTTLFCEVHDANQENEGVEEVHAVPMNSEVKYSRDDPRSYHKIDFRHLEKLIDNSYRKYAQVKVYCNDRRLKSESLLHNGIVDISLVDSPGLNRDSLKTTALFARQQEIDVVVFVVDASNHFTLSGKEFLWNAGNEKAHIFIVVNRFDLIRKKDKCRREILDQIRQLSPHTYEDADDLVHFVSAEDGLKAVQTDGAPEGTLPESFAKLEQCLRTFTLDKRAKSKLAPAQRYLTNLLSDLDVIADHNRTTHATRLENLTRELEQDAPALEVLAESKKSVMDRVDHLVEDVSRTLELDTRTRLDVAIDTLEAIASEGVEWNGLFAAWTFALDVRDRLVDHVSSELQAAERAAFTTTVEGVRDIRKLGSEVLPGNLEKDKKTSDDEKDASAPEASSLPVANYYQMDKTQDRPVSVRIELTDFLMDPRDKMNLANVSVGAVAMIGTQIFGYQNIVGMVWTVGRWVGVPRVKNTRMTWFAIGCAGLGTLTYLLSDIPRTVERRLARKLRRQLTHQNFSDHQSSRIARKSRRQLRLAGWDLQNRFHLALEREERKRESRLLKQTIARDAVDHFEAVANETERLALCVREIKID